MFTELGMDSEAGEAAFQWLCGQGLATSMGQHLAITHAGICEVEDSIRHPARDTEHFSPTVIQHVNMTFNAAVGAVQSGANATANVQQNIGAPADPQIAALIAELRAKLTEVADGTERGAAEEVVDDVAKEVSKPKPNPLRMKGYLTTLATIQALAIPAEQLARHFFP